MPRRGRRRLILRPVTGGLNGSVAVVTGATRGIGRAVAEALADQGVLVVAVGRDPGQLAEVAIRTGGSALECDLRLPGSAERVVAHALETYGRVDILVANAGIGFAGDVVAMTPETLTELVEVNVTAPLQLARACLGPMLAQGSGRLLFVTSIAGALGVPGEAVYSAAKAAVEMFADVLRAEVRDGGLTVATLLPGVVDTGFFERRGRPYDRRFPRPMPPERVARAAVRLLSDGGRRAVVPRWLLIPIRLRSAAPALYRALERRFG
jgi:short-subunit dehydrogenase